MRWARLELAQDYSHYPLKVACLPFHHHRFVFGIAKVRQKTKLPNFFAKIFKKSSLFSFFDSKRPQNGHFSAPITNFNILKFVKFLYNTGRSSPGFRSYRRRKSPFPRQKTSFAAKTERCPFIIYAILSLRLLTRIILPVIL